MGNSNKEAELNFFNHDPNWNHTLPYVRSESTDPNTPSLDTKYGTIKENQLPPTLFSWGAPYCYPTGTNKLWFFLKLAFFFFFVFYFLTSVTSTVFSWGCTLYEWQHVPKEFDFAPNRLVFQTTGGSLTEGYVQIKELPTGPGHVELSVKISSDLIDHPDLTYELTHAKSSTFFDIHIPTHYYPPHKHCIRLDAVIYVPKMNVLDVRLQNTEFSFDPSFNVGSFFIKNTNKPIDFDAVWQGENLALKTTNGQVSVTKPVLGADTVMLQTTNGIIRTTGTIQTEKSTTLETTNGDIQVENVLESPTLKITTTNAQVQVYQVNAKDVVIESSNGPLELKHANVNSSLRTHTTNSHLDVNVDTCRYCHVTATTSNSKIKINLPIDHEGPFSIETSHSHTILFEDDLNWSNIEVIGTSSIRGERYEPGQPHTEKGGRIVVQTTNENANVSFRKS